MEPETVLGYFMTALFGFDTDKLQANTTSNRPNSNNNSNNNNNTHSRSRKDSLAKDDTGAVATRFDLGKYRATVFSLDAITQQPTTILGYFLVAMFGLPEIEDIERERERDSISFQKMRTLPIVNSPESTPTIATRHFSMDEVASSKEDRHVNFGDDAYMYDGDKPNVQRHQTAPDLSQQFHDFSNLTPKARRISEQRIMLENLQAPEEFSLDITLDARSRLFGRDAVEKIVPLLPETNQIEDWTLVYSSHRDGISMHTLYRKCKQYGGSCVLFVKDHNECVFGGFVTAAPKVSEHYVGTGQSFLFKLYPKFKPFRWTYSNRFFMKCSEESLHLGSGDGKYGLWVDESLSHGHSDHCDTYNNEPLSDEKDFKVLAIEIWGVGTSY